MSNRSHHRPYGRRPLLGLLVGLFVLAALAAQPLHLMEEHGDVLPHTSMGVDAQGVEAHPNSGAGFHESPSVPGETPFSTDHGTCLDCMALSLTAVAGAWVAVPVASTPLPTASSPSPRPPLEVPGTADARPRAPPSA